MDCFISTFQHVEYLLQEFKINLEVVTFNGFVFKTKFVMTTYFQATRMWCICKVSHNKVQSHPYMKNESKGHILMEEAKAASPKEICCEFLNR